MRIVFALGMCASMLFAEIESQNIPIMDCLKSKYGHTLGGTMHSRKVLKTQLLKDIKEALPHDKASALKRIQNLYPDVCENRLIIRNCKAYYQSKSEKKVYLFDPFTFKLISIKER